MCVPGYPGLFPVLRCPGEKGPCWTWRSMAWLFLPSGLKRLCRIQPPQVLTHSSQAPLGFWLMMGSRRCMRIWQAFCGMEGTIKQLRIKGHLPDMILLSYHLSLHPLPPSDVIMWFVSKFVSSCDLARTLVIPCSNDADVEFWGPPQKLRGNSEGCKPFLSV